MIILKQTITFSSFSIWKYNNHLFFWFVYSDDLNTKSCVFIFSCVSSQTNELKTPSTYRQTFFTVHVIYVTPYIHGLFFLFPKDVCGRGTSSRRGLLWSFVLVTQHILSKYKITDLIMTHVNSRCCLNQVWLYILYNLL